jgi:hypothetical protein
MLGTYRIIRMVDRRRRVVPFIGHQFLTTPTISYIKMKEGAISETVLLLWNVGLRKKSRKQVNPFITFKLHS